MRLHPQAIDHVRDRVAAIISDAVPAPEDAAEVEEAVAYLREVGFPDMDADTLRSWRAEYAPADDEEWRQRVTDCIVATVRDAVRLPGPSNWRRWRITPKLAGWAYVSGLVAGWGTTFDWSGRHVGWFLLRGRRPYILGRKRP